jgi:hypothetical protein
VGCTLWLIFAHVLSFLCPGCPPQAYDLAFPTLSSLILVVSDEFSMNRKN